jgi:CRISPR-associated endonuclease/helicase Cas3
VALLGEAGAETLRDWFRACRIEAHERLRNGTDHVKKTLQTLLETHLKKNKDCDFPVVLLNERGDAEQHCLSEIVGKEFSRLEYRTVVLPVEAGGLTQSGILDGGITEPASYLDVAETDRLKQRENRRERWFLTETEGGDQWEQLVTGETASSPPHDLHELERVMLQAVPEGTEEERGAKYLVLMVSPRRSTLENPEIALATQTVEQHTGYIEDYIKRITRAIKLDPDLEEALISAARWHDRGKARPVWQRFACNPSPVEPLAKSTKYLHGRALGGYRHEFGSLMQAAADDAIRNHRKRDLILHLIAAHHGWARPHFETSTLDNSYTTQENQDAAAEVMRRFGQLQQRFGRWGLAWLESLLRCADIAASKHLTAAQMQSQSEEV